MIEGGRFRIQVHRHRLVVRAFGDELAASAGVEGDVQRVGGHWSLAAAEVPRIGKPDRPAGTIVLGRYIDQSR